MASYQLVIVDKGEKPVQKLAIEAADDDAAIAGAAEESLRRRMSVDVWNSEFIIRVTPFTAPLFTKQ